MSINNRVLNFNPGPAVLPLEVVESVKENLLSFKGTGIGLMEMSHRGKEFETIIAETIQKLRELLSINADYEIIFTTGGASNQFSMVPMNLLTPGKIANYILTGIWAEKAFEEAGKFGPAHVAASTKENKYRSIPQLLKLSANPAYLHFTSNNTLIGSQFHNEPEGDSTPLVCDASSDLLHKKIQVDKYGLIYAGAQKNLGTAGVTLVIVKKSLLAEPRKNLPLMMNYRTYTESNSLYNTPPTLPIFVMSEVLNWIKSIGGLDEMAKRNKEKAEILYSVIDSDDFFQGVVEPNSRSLMNVTFRLPTEELEEKFIRQAEANGIHGLRGHRLVGGLRASIYNACPKSAVVTLAQFMKSFAEKG